MHTRSHKKRNNWNCLGLAINKLYSRSGELFCFPSNFICLKLKSPQIRRFWKQGVFGVLYEYMLIIETVLISEAPGSRIWSVTKTGQIWKSQKMKTGWFRAKFKTGRFGARKKPRYNFILAYCFLFVYGALKLVLESKIRSRIAAHNSEDI